MGFQQSNKYSLAGNGNAPDAAVPVATPVSASGGGGEPFGSYPTATPFENEKRTTDGSGNDPRGSFGGGGDGIVIEWEKGEAQPSAFRDKWFAGLFIIQLFTVFGVSFKFGRDGWNKMQEFSKNDDGDKGDNYGEEGDYQGSDGNAENGSGAPEGLWISITCLALVIAPALSIMAFGFMSKNAELLIRVSLWFSVALCGLSVIIFLALGVLPIAIINLFFTVCLVVYARRVQDKIPYAASNLRCGIRALQTNLGVGFVSLGAIVFLVVFSGAWMVGAVATMQRDSMKTSASTDVDNPSELSGLGATVGMLFLLSFYWTHQVAKNVVRTSVAGVVGTWWFSPIDASSFCSTGVIDSFVRSTTYSLGSVCFGSLIVAILQVIRTMLNNARNSNSGGGIVKCIAACLLLYLERIVEYFNKWAFIYVGLYGYDYITAGKRVTSLFKTRGWSTIISDNLVYRLLGLVNLTIGILVGFCTLLLVVLVEEAKSTSEELVAGFIIGFVIGLLISGSVMGLLSSSVDAIIVCYAEAPDEFSVTHPSLSEEMRASWSAAWKDQNFTGPIVVSLDGGMGVV